MEKTIQLTDSHQLRMTVYAALFAAMIAAGAFISVPIGPVPIVLQNMFILLAGLMLGWRWGLAAVAVYLLAGALGLPVFAGGTGGIGRFAGPTGGYLIGFLPAVFVVGFLSKRGKGWQRILMEIISMILGSLIVYMFGVPWLKIVTGMTMQKALTLGLLPFLIGDAIKIAAAFFIAQALRPILSIGSPGDDARSGD